MVRKRSFAHKVISKANKVSLTVHEQLVIALLDTGSMVSTMSASLSKSLDLKVQPLEHLLTVEGAGEHRLSYLGYVQVDITCADIDLFDLSVIILVVPNTKYHNRVPVLLGTNILGLLTDGQAVQNPIWHNLLAKLAKQQVMAKSESLLGFLKTTKGQIHVRAVCSRMTVCLDGSETSLPKGLVVSPRTILSQVHQHLSCLRKW